MFHLGAPGSGGSVELISNFFAMTLACALDGDAGQLRFSINDASKDAGD